MILLMRGTGITLCATASLSNPPPCQLTLATTKHIFLANGAPSFSAAERPDVHYSLVAVDFLPPEVIQATLSKVSASLACGTITPLRQITHNLGTVATAFRQMIQASHVGKVVVSCQPSGPDLAQEQQSLPGVAITGGSGGLGLMVTQWLVQRHGPMYVRLLSRGGRVTDKAALSQLAGSPASITSHMADAGIPADVADALAATSQATAAAQGPALQALLHASGILQDAMLDKQSASAISRVFAPKLGALAALAAAAQLQPLASLTLFSSVASLLGAAGQGNYAAANAALDAWALSCQSTGGTARAIQWGAWASSGMASAAVLRRLNRIGQGAISAEQGLLSLNAILGVAPASAAAPQLPLLAVNGFLWGTYLKAGQPPLFDEFAEETGGYDGCVWPHLKSS